MCFSMSGAASKDGSQASSVRFVLCENSLNCIYLIYLLHVRDQIACLYYFLGCVFVQIVIIYCSVTQKRLLCLLWMYCTFAPHSVKVSFSLKGSPQKTSLSTFLV